MSVTSPWTSENQRRELAELSAFKGKVELELDQEAEGNILRILGRRCKDFQVQCKFSDLFFFTTLQGTGVSPIPSAAEALSLNH